MADATYRAEPDGEMKMSDDDFEDEIPDIDEA